MFSVLACIPSCSGADCLGRDDQSSGWGAGMPLCLQPRNTCRGWAQLPGLLSSGRIPLPADLSGSGRLAAAAERQRATGGENELWTVLDGI